MKNKWIIILVLVALCGMAQASLVNYYITGATGDNWSGQFEVADLNVSASDNSGNTLSISAGEWSPISSDTPGYWFYFGSGGDQLVWTYYDEVTENTYGLILDSAALSTALQANDWGTTWSDLDGDTYAINTGSSVVFQHPTEAGFSGTGGQISFSVNAVPEPATALTLALGGLLITGYRRMRKSYGHF